MASTIDDRLRAETCAEWRALGFFYDHDANSRMWVLRGSRSGLLQFCSCLRTYSADPKHLGSSEHEHYGPYSYLKFVTWSEPKIVPDGIFGGLHDFEQLAVIIEDGLDAISIGSELRIDREFSEHNEAVLVLRLEDDAFDPALCDPSCRGV